MRTLSISAVMSVAMSCLALACVGGAGELPSERRAEDNGSGVTATGQRNPTNGSDEAPDAVNQEPAAVPCEDGASCSCGSSRFVGKVRCDEGKPTCVCTLAPDGG